MNELATIHPLYTTWQGMRRRCLTPTHHKYKDYGGRGIKICERWNNFWLFVEDMGEKPTPQYSLDRIDNNGNYEPGNVRWATPLQQAQNKRAVRSNNTSGTPGVHFSKREQRWIVQVQQEGKRRGIKYFKTLEDAKAFKEAL